MTCCGTNPPFEEVDEVSRLVSDRLAAFLRTLRDNGFRIGLAESRDAAALMAEGYAARTGSLRSAFKHLFSARKSDWEKFDGLFDAFWLGKRVRSRSWTMASGQAANSPSLKTLEGRPEPGGSQSATDQVPSSDEAPEGRSGEGRTEGASRAENLAEVDFRKLADPEQVAQAHEAAAELAKVMRTQLTRRDLARRRLSARSSTHHPPQHQPRRRADQPGEAAAQGQAVAADRAARYIGLDEHVYKRVLALHPWRARRIPRG
jgi:uncharacterized protein with von Willebrand factor type A (vWA) domain